MQAFNPSKDKATNQELASSPSNRFAPLAILTLIYLLTRLYNLAGFPVFSDEAIYIHWAQIISEDWSEGFISKTDGKLPLFSWLVALIITHFEDPIVPGRLISIFAGTFTLLGVIRIGREFYSPAVGGLAGIMYITCPYALHLERMAMLESLLTACGVWMIILVHNIARLKTISSFQFLALGLVMGLAFLTKATALILLPVLVFILLLKAIWTRPDLMKGISVSLAIALLMALPFFMSSQEPVFSNRHAIFNNPEYYLSLDTLLSFPIMIWWRNLWVIADFYQAYLSITLIILTVVYLIDTVENKNQEGWILIVWALFPPLIILLIANGFYSRYFLIAVPPVILMGARGFICLFEIVIQKLHEMVKENEIWNPYRLLIGSLLLITVLSGNIFFAEKLIFNPEKAPLPKLDRLLYVEGMPSGFGLKMAAKFLQEESKISPLSLMTTVDLGNPQEGLSVYLWRKNKIQIIPVTWWPGSPRLIPEKETFPLLASKHQRFPLRQEPVSKLKNVYFLYPFTTYPETRFLKENPEYEKVWTYSHFNGKDSIKIFKMKS
jgi:4-amino-4-deoxy-L-arabinose transferase-like glycosyltransferase